LDLVTKKKPWRTDTGQEKIRKEKKRKNSREN
jgi:hypothetical protein